MRHKKKIHCIFVGSPKTVCGIRRRKRVLIAEEPHQYDVVTCPTCIVILRMQGINSFYGKMIFEPMQKMLSHGISFGPLDKPQSSKK